MTGAPELQVCIELRKIRHRFPGHPMRTDTLLSLKPTGRGSLPYLRVAILLCPSFTLTPMASFVDALRLAADRQDNSAQVYFAWDFIAAGPTPLAASCGIVMTPTGNIRDIESYDCIVVCGGLLRAMPGVFPEVLAALRRANDRGIPIIGLCTGAFVLAQAGILDGRRCALQFATISEFAHRFPKARPVTEENYVIDRNIITGPGSIVAVDIAMILIEHYGNAGRARKALDYLLLKPMSTRILSRRKPYQEALDNASQLTASAVAVMEARIDTPCSIDELARKLNTNRVRLSRAFDAEMKTSPGAFWRRIRLLQARELLYGSRRTITEVAYETGFSDTAHFCSSFKKHYGMTPLEFRKSQRPALEEAGRPSWSGPAEGQ